MKTTPQTPKGHPIQTKHAKNRRAGTQRNATEHARVTDFSNSSDGAYDGRRRKDRGEAAEKQRTLGGEGRGKAKRKHRATNGSGYLVWRKNTWTARWKVNGRIISQSLHTANRREAELELARLSAPRIGIGKREGVRKLAAALAATLDDVSDAVRVAPIPVCSLYDLWQASNLAGRGKGRTLDAYRVHINVFIEWLAAKYPEITNARNVSQVVAEEYTAWRAATRSPNTVTKSINILAAVWRSLAARYGLDYNPWSPERIARPPLKTHARRPLTDGEIAALMKAADADQRAMILLALDAGLRLGDVVTLRWPEIDFERRIIIRDTSKTGARVIPPLSRRLAETLAQRRQATADPDGLVFPNAGDANWVSRRMSRLFAAAGIHTHEKDADGKQHVEASFHSLRHTFVSRLMERGVNPYYVQRAVGHSTMMMTAHYDHSAADEIRKALDR